MDDHTHEEINLLSRLNRIPVTKSIITTAALLILVWVIEAFDVGIVNSLVLILRDVFSLTASQTGVLGAAAALGVVIGLIPSGRLADRYGRKKVAVYGVAWFCLFTLLTPIISEFWWVVALRFLTGLGQGAVFPIPYLMISELIRPNRRAVAVGYQNGLLLAAYVFPGLVGAWSIANFAPEIAWQVPFVMGGIPIVFAIVLAIWLPESPRWLLNQGRISEVRRMVEKLENEAGIEHDEQFTDPREVRVLSGAHTETVRETVGRLSLVLKPPYLQRGLIAWATFLSANMLFYVILVYFPTLFVERGVSGTNAILVVGIMSLISGVGSIIAGYAADKYGRKPLIFMYAVLSAVGVVLIAYVPLSGLYIAGLLAAFFGLAANSMTKIYIAEQYPTSVRGVGTATGEAVARLGGSVLAVYYVALILEFGGLATVVWTVGIASVALVVPMLIWGRETKGLTLEEAGAAMEKDVRV